ncbi:putative baseplate assembly protein [Halogeometricum rufum]|uniref:Putative baseplate assembly protein n=1 Tax=Halogeometricum rufum TaxID=553469 RepID=A0A1I6IQE3_9EURY|nr:putative baseplate assembly protein [Halogeometricum rufum]SFR68965.1 putative baseplate assembly protein [Halogeometricum rufum]
MTDSETPTIDGRRRAALRAAAAERARSYTPAWDPDEGDVGTAVLDLFAEITEDVLERVDRAPEKHRFAFFDALAFDRDPPQPAKLPLVFDVAPGLDANVGITPGTQALAPPPGEGSEITFEIPDGAGFEATPARLDSVVSVSPADDAIFVHHDALADEAETKLFTGANRQEHLLYVGHANFFELSTDTEFEVTVEGVGTGAFESLGCQFFGVKEVGGEEVEGWHSLGETVDGTVETADLSDGAEDGVRIRFKLSEAEAEAFAATTLPTDELRLVGAEAEAAAAEAEAAESPPVTDVETMWIRFVGPPTLGDALFEASVSKLTLSLVESDTGVKPQMLLANDVPLSTTGPIRPFGEMPLPLDTFYIASDEAFSKTETPVELGFETTDRPSLADLAPPDYSWEYWNGSGWARLELSERKEEVGEGAVRFVVPEDAAATSVSGHEHHWIRVRLLEDNPIRFRQKKDDQGNPVDPEEWEMIHDAVPEFTGLAISYPEPTAAEEAVSSKAKEPDHVVAFNNRGYGADEAKGLSAETQATAIRPFRRLPEARTAEPTEVLYLGFDGPLDDGPIQLLYSAADKPYPVPFYPRARWEFCEDPASGTWTQLDAEDGTEGLLQRGIVSLAFPEATEAFERFGRVRHWIRARLVGDPFDVTVTENAAVPGDDPPDEESAIQMLVDRTENVVVLENRGAKRFNLERFSLSVGPDSPSSDLAASLGPNESIAVSISRPTGAVELYTPDWESVPVSVRYEERAIDTVDTTAERSLQEESAVDGAFETPKPTPEPTPTPCESLSPRLLETATEATRDPPSLRGIYPNAGWAYNVVTVTGEVLGSSDGTPNQAFAFANRPVVDESVWVDELATLSEAERTAVAESGVETAEQTDDEGAPTAFWVRWTRVDDFTESTDEDRHYVLDRIDGRLTFGDGTNGATPPPGEENVSTDYRTGGGAAGNVPAEAVEALVTAIPYVEGVWNPDTGGGGAEAETTPEAANRAARTLEDRNRAVTADDFERIAASASRELARVRCVPGMDRSNSPRAGWVTVLLVPRSTERRPTPNAEVTSVVADALRRHAPVPTTTAAGDPDANRITVRGPNYVEAGVDVTVAVDETVASSIAAVETAVTTRLTAFFHPLTGGPEGEGWAFGELPCLSDVYAALERVGGVDHVVSLTVTYHGSERGYTVADDERLPTVPPDTLVCSTAHTVQATRELTTNDESEDQT